MSDSSDSEYNYDNMNEVAEPYEYINRTGWDILILNDKDKEYIMSIINDIVDCKSIIILRKNLDINILVNPLYINKDEIELNFILDLNKNVLFTSSEFVNSFKFMIIFDSEKQVDNGDISDIYYQNILPTDKLNEIYNMIYKNDYNIVITMATGATGYTSYMNKMIK